MELLPLYKSILKAAHLVVDDEGFIKRVTRGKKEPWLINGKSVVLPTDEHLKSPSTETIVFHPLFEYLTRAESEVTAEYRRTVTDRFHLSFLALASELLKIAASQQMHAKLSPEQSEFLSFVPEADEQMFKTFEELCNAIPEGQNQKAFVSMYLKRGGIVQGKSAHRAAIVSFPLYKQLVEDGQKREAEMLARKELHARKNAKKQTKEEAEKLPPVPNETYGVNLRKIDREAFIRLFEYMVPGIAEPDAYSAVSNSNIAPSMDAIMHAVQNLAAPLNDMVERFKDKLSENAQIILRVEDAWVPDFVNLAPLQVQIRMIPMQDGNAGVSPALADKKAAEAEAKASAPPQGVPQSTQQAPMPPAQEEEHAPPGFRLPPKKPQPQAAQPPMQPPPAQPIPPAYPAYSAPAGYPPPYAAVPPAAMPPVQPMAAPGVPAVHPSLQAFAAPYMASMGAPVVQQDLPTWAYGGGTQRPIQPQGQPQQGYAGYPYGYPMPGVPRGDF